MDRWQKLRRKLEQARERDGDLPHLTRPLGLPPVRVEPPLEAMIAQAPEPFRGFLELLSNPYAWAARRGAELGAEMKQRARSGPLPKGMRPGSACSDFTVEKARSR